MYISFDKEVKKYLDKLGYSLERRLGSGGFGITYLVKDKKKSKDLYVIKTIRDENFIYNSTDNLIKELKLIRNEAEKLQNLKQHPHIVTIYDLLSRATDFDSQDNHTQSESPYDKLELLFLRMEYIEGEDLKKVVEKRSAPLKEAEALRYISQICEALIHIHNHNEPLLHRDIKPQNIMVRKDSNEAVLIDFGIARNFTSKTQTYTAIRTEAFCAPEQLKEYTKLGNYTDIYGLAATLYYLLTKKYPCSSDSRINSGKILKEPQEDNVTISDRVNEAILWGMELDFKKRPQTVQEWLELLNPDKVKYDAEDLVNSSDKLKKAIITYFDPNELDVFLCGFNRNIDYDDLDGNYLPEKVKSLINQLSENDIKNFIEAMKGEKPEAFT